MKETSNVVLEVRDLGLCYELEHGFRIHALNGISFTTQQGECLGLVGESGSGKSTVAKAVLQLLPSNATVTKGEVFFKGQDITRISENQMKDLRWSQISLVTQSAMNALNVSPTYQTIVRYFPCRSAPMKSSARNIQRYHLAT